MASLTSVSRGALGAAVLVVSALPHGTLAVTRSWSAGAAAGTPWTDPSAWGGTAPGAADDAWVNTTTANPWVFPGVDGLGAQIVIGRNVAGPRLDLSGGSLIASGEVLIGQYTGGSGLVVQSGGLLKAGTNFSIGGTGMGTLLMTGGSVVAGGTLHVNRYTAVGASGWADVYNGTLAANTLAIGPAGDLTLDNSTLTLNGDKRTLVNGYIASGQLAHHWAGRASLAVAYDSVAAKTVVSAPQGRAAAIAAQGPEIRGDRAITYNYAGLRRLSPAPAAGVHPRVYFNTEELPAIRARLASTQVGQEAMRMIRLYTSLLRDGRQLAWDSKGDDVKKMQDGSARISNVGLYDRSALYDQLIAGNTTLLATLANDSTSLYALGGLLSLEAFECLVDEGAPGVAQRQADLAAALTTWASWVAPQTDFPGPAGATYSNKFANHFRFGGHHTALAYDLAYNAMSTQQRTTVRGVLARMMGGYFASDNSNTEYFGVGVENYAFATNHVSIGSFKLLTACALEGEVTTADAGYSSAELDAWLARANTSFHKFLTYGWYSSGAPLEGQGKNYLYGAHLIALARRGSDYFGHPHLRAYKDRWIPAVTQPFGYSFLEYDILGGSGPDNERGRGYLEALDFVALKWMFPGDAAADFAWRNYVRTEWKDATGAWRTFTDLRDSKFSLRSVYHNQLLPAAIFAADVDATGTWAAQNATVQPGLDYLDKEGGTVVSRSGFDTDATALTFHVRQDLGGHTFADRNTFTLSALGRLFVNYNSGTSNSGLHEPIFHSIIEVDGKSMKVTPQEGSKLRIPSTLAAAVADSGTASFATGDATYAYSNEWRWNNYPKGGTLTLTAGYVPETNTHNSFRTPGNRITAAFGDYPLVSFPHWENPDKIEGIQKKPYNPMRQVYRTIGLVRGAKPYVLVIDDVRKDDATHTYKWFASVAKDLTLLTGAALPFGCDPATDVVLAEPAATGDRRLLVRVLRADGTPAQAAGSTGSALAYLETVASPNTTETWRRLVIERQSVVAPNYRVLLFPFRAGESVPATTLTASDLSVAIGPQVDTYAFTPRTRQVAGQDVTMSEFTLTRSGATLLDYRGRIQPTEVR